MAQSVGAAIDSEATAGNSNSSCLECHREAAADHAASIHRGTPCLACHLQAVREDHEQMAQVECNRCHSPHDEKMVHDPHSRVTCLACHVNGGVPVVNPGSKEIIFSGIFQPGRLLPIHQSIVSKTEISCQRCHFHGNRVGALSTTLPPKGILCIPCHVATLSLGDTTTLLFLSIFLAGMAGLAWVWSSGAMNSEEPHGETIKGEGIKAEATALFKPGIFLNVLLEGILLKRLFHQSKSRWTIHALIFFPFLMRLAFGLTDLFLSLCFPDWEITHALMDKNHVVHALFFDVTGVMILGGSMAAFGRKRRDLSEAMVSVSLAAPGWGMALLIGVMVVNGFILEGVRIAMTGWPEGSQWAFIGYGASLLIKGMTGLTDLYAYLWYAHAILAGAFIALIPFTQMAHIITAPIVLISNALSQAKDRP